MHKYLESLSKKHPELWKFIKFNITVIITSALDIITYLICIYFVFVNLNDTPLSNNALLSFIGIKYQGYLFSYLISTTIGYVAMYIINRKITFHANNNIIYSTMLYFILSVFNILISSLIGGIFGSFIIENSISTPIIEIISKFIIINIPTIWTYPLERYIIQKRGNKKYDTKTNCL